MYSEEQIRFSVSSHHLANWASSQASTVTRCPKDLLDDAPPFLPQKRKYEQEEAVSNKARIVNIWIKVFIKFPEDRGMRVGESADYTRKHRYVKLSVIIGIRIMKETYVRLRWRFVLRREKMTKRKENNRKWSQSNY